MELSKCDPGKIQEIKDMFTKTFSDSEGLSEGVFIGNLAYDLMTSSDKNDIFYFVASENERIIGCIFFSRLTFESGINAFLLAPVAVHTDYQGRGIGQKLINFGLNALREKGVELVFTYGDIKFYSRVGFGLIDESIAKAPLKLTYPLGWLCQSLDYGEIKPVAGNSCCIEALNKQEYW